MAILDVDFLYSTMIGVMVLFFALWVLILGVGFALGLREETVPAEDSLRMLPFKNDR